MSHDEKGKPRRAAGAGGAEMTASGERSRKHYETDAAQEQDEGAALNRARFAWLNAVASNPSISARELRSAVFLVLGFASMIDTRTVFGATGKIVVFPSQETLAALMNCTRQNVAGAAKGLAKRGYLSIKPGNGRGNASEYTLILPIVGKGNSLSCPLPNPKKATAATTKGNYTHGKRATRSVAPVTISPSQNANHNGGEGGCDINESEKINAISEKQYADSCVEHDRIDDEEAAFDKLCRIWPNRNFDPGKARGAWINNVVVRDIDPNVVLEGARDSIDEWKRRNTGMIPFLGKWLAQQGWNKAEGTLLSDEHRMAISTLAFLSDQSLREACANTRSYCSPGMLALRGRLVEILDARSSAEIATLAVFLWVLYGTLSEVNDMLDRLKNAHGTVRENDIGKELCDNIRLNPNRPVAQQFAAFVAAR